MNRRHFLFCSAALLGSLPLPWRARAGSPELLRSNLSADPAYLRLSTAAREPWNRWLAASERLRGKEIALFDAELAGSGRKRSVPAKEGSTFEVGGKSAAWYGSAEARKIADNLLTWQTPTGGWSKNTAMTKHPRPAGQRWGPWEEWHYVATIDNKATTSQNEFLALVATATGEARYAAGVERGLRYLLAAQMPSGGWPQVFPLQGNYHDWITFNDDAMVRVLVQLREVKNNKAPWRMVGESLCGEIDDAVQNGIDCILRCQIRVHGSLTAWCAQHHPISFAPESARAYELASISGGESTGIIRFLMSLGRPSPEVRAAVEAAIAWLERSRIDPVVFGKKGTKGPQWARFYDIETNRPLFSDEDGERRFSFSEVRQKRHSYSWFSKDPASLLSRDYPKWKRRISAAA